MIELSQVTKAYGQKIAVHELSLQVARGEMFAFLGPNGAGKSTVVKMLTTMLRPTRGSILLAGKDVVAHPTEARRLFGVVFQEASLDDVLTAYEALHLHSVLYGLKRRERPARIEEMLRFVDLWDERANRVGAFSGGMKRRLEIARCLLHRPQMLFLDEPTLGVDSKTRRQLWEHVHRLNEEHGITVFFSTHYMEEAERVAQRIAIIDRGTIVSLGTPAQIKQRAGAISLDAAFLHLTDRIVREAADAAQAAGHRSAGVRVKGV